VRPTHEFSRKRLPYPRGTRLLRSPTSANAMASSYASARLAKEPRRDNVLAEKGAAPCGQKQRRSPVPFPDLVERLAPSAGYRFDGALALVHRRGWKRRRRSGRTLGIARGCRKKPM
jgi:hypothetical protein